METITGVANEVPSTERKPPPLGVGQWAEILSTKIMKFQFTSMDFGVNGELIFPIFAQVWMPMASSGTRAGHAACLNMPFFAMAAKIKGFGFRAYLSARSTSASSLSKPKDVLLILTFCLIAQYIAYSTYLLFIYGSSADECDVSSCYLYGRLISNCRSHRAS